MALYLISYDINEKDAFEYKRLWAKLDELGATKILYSEWVLPGGSNQQGTIYNEIAPLTQGKDRLLVQEIGAASHWDKLLISDDEFRNLLRNSRF
jgi:hypothetical protein